MGSYSEELHGLARTYASLRIQPDDSAIARVMSVVRDKNVYFVGSGGTFAIAELAANLHHASTGRFALAVTPLRLVETVNRTPSAAVVIFSARAKHPDTAFAASHAIAMGLPVVLITQRKPIELDGPFTHPNATILTLPSDGPADGFLATNSVLAMAITILRVYSLEALPTELSAPTFDSAPFRDRVLVLYGQQGRAAAQDIETRLHELGLADVQLSDYRNFAHGRHVGLDRRASTSTVVALIDPTVASLARRTLSILPTSLDVREVETVSQGPIAAVELLAGVMPIVSAFAADQGGEPSKPKVTEFGRALYHLPFKRLYPPAPETPPARKARVSGIQPSAATLRPFVDAYREWIQRLNSSDIDALVLDYDGTCVRTADRYELPSTRVQESLLRVVDSGLPLTFATGRGDSIYNDLRRWVPKAKWPSITLALHNGAWLQELCDDLLESKQIGSQASTVASALQPLVDGGIATLRISGDHASLESAGRVTVSELRTIVASTLSSRGHFTVASSAHSVDIFAEAHGKGNVVAAAQRRFGAVLAVGDQGAEGGNDYELLAQTELSVSVDTCSIDLTRCWNVTDASTTGPDALVFLLSHLVTHRGASRLKLKKPLLAE